MRTMMVKTKKALTFVFLSIVTAVACIFGVRALTKPKTAVAETKVVTGTDMIDNKAKLKASMVNDVALNVSAVDGTISSGDNGGFVYYETVDAVSFDMKVLTEGHTQMTFALRAANDGSMWSEGATGYYAFINGTTVELYDVSNPASWNTHKIASGTAANLYDGEKHTVAFSAIDDGEGNVDVSFSVDGETAITGTDNDGSVLSSENTAFKIWEVNKPNAFSFEVYGDKLVVPTDYTVVTADDMLSSGNLTDGANALPVVLDTAASTAEGKMVYNDATVEAVKFDLKVNKGTTGQLFFAFRTKGVGAVWEGGGGYFFMVLDTNITLFKHTESGFEPALATGTTTLNVYDGEKHTYELVAANDDNNRGVYLSIKIDGTEVLSTWDIGNVPAMEGTHFLISAGDGNTTSKMYGENGQDVDLTVPTDYTVVTADDMVDNMVDEQGVALPSLAGTVQVSAANGVMYYDDATVEAVKTDVKVLQSDASSQVFFALRTKGVGPVWNGGGGYFFMVQGSGVTLFKSEATGTAFTQIATGSVASFFDGAKHTVELVAANNAGDNAVYLSMKIDGTEVLSTWDIGNVPVMDNTHFLIAGNAASTVVKMYDENGVDLVVPTDYTAVDVDDMLGSGNVYQDAEEGSPELKSFLDVITATGDGRIVYKDSTVEAVSLKARIVTGESVFMTMRATSGKAVWDGGLGYYFMFNKTATGASVQVIKGVEESANGNFKVVVPDKAIMNIFDGEQHMFELVAADDATGTATWLSLSIDGTEIFGAWDATGVQSMTGTHFLITHGQGTSKTITKLYGAAGFDLNIPDDAYQTITSKTLLTYSSDWLLEGAVLDGTTSLTGNRDQTKALFGRVMENTMFNFDIELSDMGLNWVAILLNANKIDAIWNQGFRSNAIMIRKDPTSGYVTFSIEYWQPQQVIGATAIEVLAEEKMNIECGMYTVEHTDGTKYTFIRLAVNGTEIYNEPLLGDATYVTPGYFGITNYGTAKYTLSATESESDSITSTTDGAKIDRADESAIATNLSHDNFALIINSFNPYMDLTDDNAFKLINRGAATFGDKVDFNKLSFEFSLENVDNVPGQYFEFMFNKKRQESFIGQKLAENYTNYGYGVRILPSGTIYLIKTDAGDSFKILMTYDYGVDTGNTFENGYNKITIYRSLENDALTITIFVNDEQVGYSYTDTDYYAENYPMSGFIGIQNSANSTSVNVKNLKIEGSVERVSHTLLADAVNFINYYEDETPYLYFSFDSASYTTRWVEVYGTDAEGQYTVLLGRVYPKNRRFEIPSTYTGTTVKVVTCGFTDAGNKEAIVYLEDKEGDLTVDETRNIAIKESENGAYFVYAGTDEEFLPTGANYMGLRGGDHSTFDAATSFTEADYDPEKTDTMMRSLAENGGNFIRVFLIGRSTTNPGISGDPEIPVTNEEYYFEGLYRPYMENVEHFLRTAKKYGIYVMLTLGDADVPSNSYYLDLQGGYNLGRNEMYLTEAGILARSTYAANVAKYFKEVAPDCRSAIFSIELQNEFAMNGLEAPFSLTEGTVTLPNGKTYDMGDADSRQLAHDEGAVYYLNSLVRAIKAVDDTMLVNEGSYTLNIVGNNNVHGLMGNTSGDNRYPCTFDVYFRSEIDFLDVHIYFANVNNNTVYSSFSDDLTYMNFWEDEVQTALKSKPILMGEFGPNYNIFPTQEEAAHVWQETVRLAQEAGFKGFACWTLESHDQKECWNILSDDGKFDLFRSLVRTMRGLEETVTGITAENVNATAGEAVASNIQGLQKGDKVYYRIGGDAHDWHATDITFSAPGTYTVEYKVVRYGAAESVPSTFKVTVAENTQGGDAPVVTTHTVKFTVDGEEYDSQTVVENECAVRPTAPTKDGYTFVCWMNGTDEFDFTTPITGDVELVASFEKNDVDLPPVGGDDVTPPEGGDEGDDVTPPVGGDEGDDVTPPEGGGEGDDVTPPEGGDDSGDNEDAGGCAGCGSSIGLGLPLALTCASIAMVCVKRRKED